MQVIPTNRYIIIYVLASHVISHDPIIAQLEGRNFGERSRAALSRPKHGRIGARPSMTDHLTFLFQRDNLYHLGAPQRLRPITEKPACSGVTVDINQEIYAYVIPNGRACNNLFTD